MVDIDKTIDILDIKPNLRVALRNDSYVLHKVSPYFRFFVVSPFTYGAYLHQILPSKVDPLVSLMRVEKVPDSTYETLGGLDKQVVNFLF